VDIVEQLVLRTFDDFQQVPTCINEESDDSKNDSPKKNASMENVTNEQISIASLNENVLNETILDEEQSNPEKLNSDFVKGINSNPNNTEIAANISNIPAKQCKDSSISTIKNMSNNSAEKQLLHGSYVLNKFDESKLFSQSEKSKSNEYVTNQILHEPELELLSCVKETNTIDPLKCSSEFNCNDEFVNTNLLDNPEILKNFGINSDNTSFFKDNTTVLESKTEDSDIEILENVENEKKIVEKKNAEDDTNQMMDSESSKKSIETKEQLVCNTTKDKCISENSPIHSLNLSIRQEKPLTLDDIKDTGCAGLELYKCGYSDCSFAAPNASLLRAHMKECNFGVSNKNLFCPHCKKRFVKIGFLLEHLKAHGLKRFGCSQCKMRYAVSYQATAHMKTKHKFPNTKLVPADPTNPSVDGLFVVHAIVSISSFLSFFLYFSHFFLCIHSLSLCSSCSPSSLFACACNLLYICICLYVIYVFLKNRFNIIIFNIICIYINILLLLLSSLSSSSSSSSLSLCCYFA